MAVATHLIVASMMMGLIGDKKPTVVSSYTGPGDVISGAKAWWGLRAYSAATAGIRYLNVILPQEPPALMLILLQMEILIQQRQLHCTMLGSLLLTFFTINLALIHVPGHAVLLLDLGMRLLPALTFNCGSLPCLNGR